MQCRKLVLSTGKLIEETGFLLILSKIHICWEKFRKVSLPKTPDFSYRGFWERWTGSESSLVAVGRDLRYINSGCIGIDITRNHDTAVPFPYRDLL